MLKPLNLFWYLALMVSGIGGLLWSAPPDTPWLVQALMTLVLYGPLLLFAVGVCRHDARLLTWLCFVLLFYFCGFTVQLLDPPPRSWIAAVRVLCTVALFTTSVVLIRRQRGVPARADR
ncbi:DUF2069 domain-containing protein [Isoalcanivorax beigongshangi]|uniref:DUF2069 domain-containing protein n=1 Tax=Isoalcanivorax beigongshangi TaxID=3238810 RepID=A0ABV4AHY1_9GAMM